MLPGKLGSSERTSAPETLSGYLKGVAKDGKLYQDRSFDAVWDGQIAVEDGQVLGETFCVKLGEYGWNINAAYMDEPGMAYAADGEHYPYFHLTIARIAL